MARYFTLREAEGLIPALQEYLKAAIAAKERIGAIDGEMRELSARIFMVGGMEVHPDRVARKKLERVMLMKSLQNAVEEIQSSGCVIKDLDIGLLDFPALLDGVEVYLCWRLGETKIEWWHSTQEGYAGRRRIVDEFNADDPSMRPN